MWNVNPLLGALIPHGHADHHGGAAYLQGVYGIQHRIRPNRYEAIAPEVCPDRV